MCGTSVLGVHDDDALENVHRFNQRLTFAERIYAICDLLWLSKDQCNKLLKGEMLAVTVACPLDKAKDVKANAQNNKYEQHLLRLGRDEERRQSEAQRQLEAWENGELAAAGTDADRKRQTTSSDDDDTQVDEGTARCMRRRDC